MNNKPLSYWLKQQKNKWTYPRYVAKFPCKGISMAAEAMFVLNRGAKHHEFRHDIYRLKSVFIEWLYKQGYCRKVQRQTQTLVCYHCSGSGVDPYSGWRGIEHDSCERCGGSGIYASHTLYQFTFSIGLHTYVWHQPASLVKFAVENFTDEIGEYDEKTANEYLPDITFQHHFMTVYAFLRNQGIPASALPPLLTFREALNTSIHWYWLNHYVYQYPKPLHLRLVNHIGMRVREWLSSRHEPEYIPF